MKKNNIMGKKEKAHRKKVQARNQRLKREEATLVNLFKQMQTAKGNPEVNNNVDENKNN